MLDSALDEDKSDLKICEFQKNELDKEKSQIKDTSEPNPEEKEANESDQKEEKDFKESVCSIIRLKSIGTPLYSFITMFFPLLGN